MVMQAESFVLFSVHAVTCCTCSSVSKTQCTSVVENSLEVIKTS